MTNQFKLLDTQLNDKDSVISLNNIVFKVEKLIEIANKVLEEPGISTIKKRLSDLGQGELVVNRFNDWINSGIQAELLRPNGTGWKKGKARIRVMLEFCPDEPDEEKLSSQQADSIEASPLDDIRQNINKNSQ